jgi:hypothetical protein
MGADTRNPIYPAGQERRALYYLPTRPFASGGMRLPAYFFERAESQGNAAVCVWSAADRVWTQYEDTDKMFTREVKSMQVLVGVKKSRLG